MTRIKDFLWTLVRPHFWSMQCHYLVHVEDTLNEIMDTEASLEDDITVQMKRMFPEHFHSDKEYNINKAISIHYKGQVIWTSNYPYAYGTINNYRASRRTIWKFRQYIKNYYKIHPEELI